MPTFHLADALLDVGHTGGTRHALDGEETLVVVAHFVRPLVETHRGRAGLNLFPDFQAAGRPAEMCPRFVITPVLGRSDTIWKGINDTTVF
jgi:hypothetical protein